ncbi:hypothetical protein [Sphingomonas crusticola]|jgi:hypothetical protein|uniref:hypothetical protein n=1 Tax=Sphingomonas crusticola TaxID=1697973 RepID=UPI000E27EE97|nr:hypothetical protein [Sphingomonas crusticola]
MRKLLTASVAALALTGVTLGAAAPAEARYHGGRGYYGHGYYGHYHGGGRTAAVLGAGILGLAAGAAIADSHRGYYGGYGYAPAYYGPGPAYYDGGYGYYDRGPVCRTDWRWDGYARRYVRIQYCD